MRGSGAREATSGELTGGRERLRKAPPWALGPGVPAGPQPACPLVDRRMAGHPLPRLRRRGLKDICLVGCLPPSFLPEVGSSPWEKSLAFQVETAPRIPPQRGLESWHFLTWATPTPVSLRLPLGPPPVSRGPQKRARDSSQPLASYPWLFLAGTQPKHRYPFVPFT